MEKILKKLYIFLIVATIISGCRSFVSFNGETYTPEKESLALINESICVYTHYDIIQNKEQPRKRFDDEKLSELADSIKKHGIMQPVIVQKEEDKYLLIAGALLYTLL